MCWQLWFRIRKFPVQTTLGARTEFYDATGYEASGEFVERDHSLNAYVNFRKTNISYSLIRARTCVYQGLRSVSFAENFAHGLNK